MKLGSTDISKVYLGSTEVTKAYLGSTLVHGNDIPLPYDAKVDWLGYDGLQYIDTGITPNETIEVEIKFMPTNANVNSTGLFACRNSASPSTGSQYFPLQIWNNGNKVALCDNLYDSGWKNGLTYDTASVVSISGRALYINGTLVVSSGKTNEFSFNVTYGLLRCHLLNDNWDSRRGTSGRIYYAKIWKDGSLVRDYITVVKDNVGYLYDKVSQELFENKGTGSFLYGNDVVNS